MESEPTLSHLKYEGTSEYTSVEPDDQACERAPWASTMTEDLTVRSVVSTACLTLVRGGTVHCRALSLT